jgi:ABC-type transport system involved in cytochrome c biogenesis ATPase subunit
MIVLPAGNFIAEGAHTLAHTPTTLSRLEQLAAVAQSGRAVLLEGPTCSGKTALVVELARLAQRRLVVVNLSAETGEERGHGVHVMKAYLGFQPAHGKRQHTTRHCFASGRVCGILAILYSV